MTAPLEGAALFRAAAVAIGAYSERGYDHYTPSNWSLVPAMLEWLRHQTVTLWKWSDGTYLAEIPSVAKERARDLPTALARLVLKVAELEGRA